MPWIVLAIAAAGIIGFAAQSSGGKESINSHVTRLSSELRCVDCEGLSVADSNTESAIAIRADIATRLRHGESDGEIRRYYVNLYGSSILLRPPGSGIGLVVWGLPVLVLVLAGAGIALALRRWSRQTRMEATDDDVTLVAAMRTTAATRDVEPS